MGTSLVWLIEPYQEPFRTIDLQPVDFAIPPHDIRLHSEAGDFVTLLFAQGTRGRLEILPHRSDVRDRKIELHPSGRTRRTKIMTDDDKDPAITIGPNVISLRMVQPLNDRRMQHLFKESFMQCNIGRFNLKVFEALAKRCLT